MSATGGSAAWSAALSETLSAALDGPVEILGRIPMSGGDSDRVERVDTSRGRFVVKQAARPIPGRYAAEAAGLRALRAAESPLRVPEVIAVDDAALILEYVAPATPPRDAARRLGEGLAALHRCGAPRFGFEVDGWCGRSPQPNPWTPRWLDFYRDARLGPQLRRARDGGALDAADARRGDRLLSSLDRWLDEPPGGPALIHGDLWSGNLLWDARGAPTLIDPAAAFAHPEAELGMMRLFGGFPSETFAVYESAAGLEPDWRAREPLYALYHLLNHLNLFGSGYRRAVSEILERFAGT